MVSKYAFEWVNLCRYISGDDPPTAAKPKKPAKPNPKRDAERASKNVVGLYKLHSVDP